MAWLINNQVYTYKVKDIGLGSPGAPHQKAKKPPKLEKVIHNGQQQAISGYNHYNLSG